MLIEIRNNKIQIVVRIDSENESIEWVTLEQIKEAFKSKTYNTAELIERNMLKKVKSKTQRRHK